MPNHPEVVTLEEFAGIGNKNNPERKDGTLLDKAVNVDISSSGAIRMRQGFTKVVDSNNEAHSLWSQGSYCFFVDGTELKRFDPETYNVTDLNYEFQGRKVAYDQLSTLVFATDGEKLAVIENGDKVRDAGVPVPNPVPRLSENQTGTMYPGTYLVTVTYVASDGRESGAPPSQEITLENTGGILLQDLPNSSEASTIKVYASTVDGETLYEALEVPVGVGTALVTTVSDTARPLDSQFLEPMVPGQQVVFYRGYLLVSQDNRLYFSEPNDYERTKPHFNFYEFPRNITSIMPMEDGFFVSADHLYFVRGTDMNNLDLQIREFSVTVVPGTETRITGGDVVLEGVPTGFKWLCTTNRGILLLGPGGLVFNLTESNVFVDFAEEGTGFFRSQDGINQYVSLLRNPENPRMKMGDTATAEVRRNGISV